MPENLARAIVRLGETQFIGREGKLGTLLEKPGEAIAKIRVLGPKREANNIATYRKVNLELDAQAEKARKLGFTVKQVQDPSRGYVLEQGNNPEAWAQFARMAHRIVLKQKP